MEMKKKNEVGGKWEMVELFNLVEELPCNYGDEPDVHEFLGNVVKVSNVDAEGILYKEFEKRSFKKRDFEKLVCQKNDLLVVKSSGSKTNILSGKTAIVKDEKDLIASNFLMRLRVNLEIANPKYLWYYLNSKHSKNFIISIVGATTYPNLKWDLYSKMQIPLPPLATQQRIAAILDAADALRRKDQELLRKYDELAQAIFIDMFGDPVKNEKGWEVKRLGEVTNQITKGESPNWQGFKYENEGILFITSENVLWGSLNLKENTTKYISNNFHQKLKRSQLMLNDVLINLVGASIGRCAVVTNDYLPSNINQAVASIRVDSKTLNSTFLLHQIINDELQKLVTGNIVDAARANISLGNLRDLSIIVPPLDIQNKFTTCLGHLSLIKKNTLNKESETLFQSLLQQAFSGELKA